MKLALKLAIGLMAAAALVFAVFAWQLRSAQTRAAEQMVTTSAERLCDIIRRGARFQMLRNDREALYRMMRDIGSEPGIRQVRIFSKTGQISFSTIESEVNRVVDKSAEACYVCHAQAAPLEKLTRKDRARIFTSPQGERVLGVIMPVENQPDCWTAACHIHPEKQKVLGVIDAQLSLATVDRQVADQQALLFRFTAAAIAMLGLATIAFIWLMVYRPLNDLVGGIRRVAKGNLTNEIPVRSRNDEIGELATEFNHMTSELRDARTQITDWTHTLEQRVDRKSRELERAHHSLLHSEKLASVGKLAATVAHEINNPLFGILTNARLARKAIDQSPQLDDAGKSKIGNKLVIIERESNRCGEIVKNLLMFSRQAPPRFELVPLDAVVERTLSLVRHSYQLQNIQLDVSLEHHGAQIQGDAGQLQQMLLVLLVNASEALQGISGAQVCLSTRLDNQTVVISVKDNGPGIPEDVRERIFEPFFTTKQEGPRTGLGLAIALGILEQHQGSIQVQSEPGKGTEFLLRLPCATSSSETTAGTPALTSTP
jgi:two-component system NtrC family sensor kinase